MTRITAIGPAVALALGLAAAAPAAPPAGEPMANGSFAAFNMQGNGPAGAQLGGPGTSAAAPSAVAALPQATPALPTGAGFPLHDAPFEHLRDAHGDKGALRHLKDLGSLRKVQRGPMESARERHAPGGTGGFDQDAAKERLTGHRTSGGGVLPQPAHEAFGGGVHGVAPQSRGTPGIRFGSRNAATDRAWDSPPARDGGGFGNPYEKVTNDYPGDPGFAKRHGGIKRDEIHSQPNGPGVMHFEFGDGTHTFHIIHPSGGSETQVFRPDGSIDVYFYDDDSRLVSGFVQRPDGSRQEMVILTAGEGNRKPVVDPTGTVFGEDNPEADLARRAAVRAAADRIADGNPGEEGSDAGGPGPLQVLRPRVTVEEMTTQPGRGDAVAQVQWQRWMGLDPVINPSPTR